MLQLRRDINDFVWSTKDAFNREELPMSVSSHVQELRRKHQNLSETVEQAQRSPGVDDLQIAALKREKLRLKEEIQRLSS